MWTGGVRKNEHVKRVRKISYTLYTYIQRHQWTSQAAVLKWGGGGGGVDSLMVLVCGQEGRVWDSGGGMHCGFIPANTFIMADLAEPVTHGCGYISGTIPSSSPNLTRALPFPPTAPQDPLTKSSPKVLPSLSMTLRAKSWQWFRISRQFTHQNDQKFIAFYFALLS